MGWEDSSYFNCRDTFYDQGKPPPSLGDAYQKRYREPFVYKNYNYRTSHNENEIHPVFKIKKSSSQEDFKEVYREMILEHHPDKGGSHDKFIEVQDAWDELNFR
tara:strand:- start:319 stop:630 length:312 start_codon:yes stop_codon:yes gene_type:complete